MKKTTLIGLLILSDVIALGLFGFAFLQTPESGDLFSNPIAFVAIGLFVVVPSALVIIYSLTQTGPEADLLRSGTLSYATVLDTWDIRPGTNSSSAQVGLKLQVNPPTDPPYETKTTITVSALNPTSYHAGMVVKVRYDPRHPKRVVIDEGGAGTTTETVAAEPSAMHSTFSTQVNVNLPQGITGPDGQPTSFPLDGASMAKLPPAIQKLIQAALVDADHNGIPDIAEKGGAFNQSVQTIDLSGKLGQAVDPQERIAKLEKLVDAGLINAEMFALLKSKIEAAAQKRSGDGMGGG